MDDHWSLENFLTEKSAGSVPAVQRKVGSRSKENSTGFLIPFYKAFVPT